MMMKLIFLIFTLSCLIQRNEGARILGVFPMAGRSHYILDNALMRGLAEAGHDVTLISPFSEKDPPEKGSWREIVLDGILEYYQEYFQDFNPLENPQSPFLSFIFLNSFGNQITERTLQNPNVQKLLKSNEKFDIVIIGAFLNEGLTTLAKHFDVHLILMSPLGANMWNYHLAGIPALPSLNPELALSYPMKMSFCQRFKNTVFRIINYVNLNFVFYPKQNEIVQKYLPKPISLEESLNNVSLILLNSHVSLSKPQALVPNMIEIGGFHIRPQKKLPLDLQTFLDDAKDGVIYFSMGSNLKSKDLPIGMRNEILKAFGKRKEKILWKWEDDDLPGKPKNVFLKKWFPQQDILAHPNVKVFITHGGFLSSTETVYHGVPIIAIPVFGDQWANAILAEELGFGFMLPMPQISEERLTSLLDGIIYNPKYLENIQARSRIMHDRQVEPIDTAVYWVEYVMRHNGAKHLRVAYLDQVWYQFYMLDVFSIILGTVYISLIVMKTLLQVLCRSKKEERKSKTN